MFSGFDPNCIPAPGNSASAPMQVSAILAGRTYAIRRDGQDSSFLISFQPNGRLEVLLNVNGQRIEETWQPSFPNKHLVSIGGRFMAAAELALGSRNYNAFGDPTELWEPSPPPNVAPLIGTLVARQCSSQPGVSLTGRTYTFRRCGQDSNVSVTFQPNGKLAVLLNGQLIEEVWQASLSNPSLVLLGGRTMPAAVIAIGAGNHNTGCDPDDLWEPSPPPGVAPLMGTWQRDSRESFVGIAMKLELLVDRSGSMQHLQAATVQGLNHLLSQQRALPHASCMTMRLITFDDRVETPWPEGTPVSDLSRNVNADLVGARGCTALLDAIGITLSSTPLQPPRVVCIVTDGLENSSRQYTRQRVNELIAERRNAGWTFIFLAANQDAIAEGASLGIGAGTCATFSANPAGLYGGFESASSASCRGALFGSGAAAFSAAERSACQN